jgi:hypothetical protein
MHEFKYANVKGKNTIRKIFKQRKIRVYVETTGRLLFSTTISDNYQKKTF